MQYPYCLMIMIVSTVTLEHVGESDGRLDEPLIGELHLQQRAASVGEAEKAPISTSSSI
jgi:hypothetical protein